MGDMVMARLPFNPALIIGVGPDISASLARRLSAVPVGDGCIEDERRIPFGIYRPYAKLFGGRTDGKSDLR
jgi:hypothetical protein